MTSRSKTNEMDIYLVFVMLNLKKGLRDIFSVFCGRWHLSFSQPSLRLLYVRQWPLNGDLAQHVAKKAKLNGLKQFIFMSSILVYGSGKNVIDKNTLSKPSSCYGVSKLEAEQYI